MMSENCPFETAALRSRSELSVPQIVVPLALGGFHLEAERSGARALIVAILSIAGPLSSAILINLADDVNYVILDGTYAPPAHMYR